MPTPEDTSTIFYYPGMSSFQPDGTLVMRASGYEGDCHWSGEHRVPPDDPDYKFWCWLREGFRAASRGATPFLSRAEFPMARKEFRRSLQTNPNVA